MFNFLNTQQLEERAKEDARLGIYNPDSYILSTLGPEPLFDPVDNFQHGEVGSRLQNPIIDESQQDLRREEDEMARFPSALLLIAFLAVLLFMETAGSIYVMRTLGIESPERLIFGTALGVCIFFITWLCSRARSRLMSIGALVALGALVAALTLIRVDENAGEDSSTALDFATALIMMAVTVGPAVMAEHVLRLLAPVLPVVRRIVRMRARLNQATRQQKSANRFVERLSVRRERWKNESARRRAMYDIAYRAARAELGDASATTSVPPWVEPNRSEQLTLMRIEKEKIQ